MYSLILACESLLPQQRPTSVTCRWEGGTQHPEGAPHEHQDEGYCRDKKIPQNVLKQVVILPKPRLTQHQWLYNNSLL